MLMLVVDWWTGRRIEEMRVRGVWSGLETYLGALLSSIYGWRSKATPTMGDGRYRENCMNHTSGDLTDLASYFEREIGRLWLCCQDVSSPRGFRMPYLFHNDEAGITVFQNWSPIVFVWRFYIIHGQGGLVVTCQSWCPRIMPRSVDILPHQV